jgi:hypothetical protein
VPWAISHQVGSSKQKKRPLDFARLGGVFYRAAKSVFKAEERKVAYRNSRPPDENATRLYRCWATTGLAVHSSKDVEGNTKVHSCDCRNSLLALPSSSANGCASQQFSQRERPRNVVDNDN